MNEIMIHERLAQLETGQLYTNKTLDEVRAILAAHASVNCDGSCDVAKKVDKCTTSLSTYKRITWASLVVILSAGLKSLFIP
jgi:hypothetical protein